MNLTFHTLEPKDMQTLYPYFFLRPNKTCDSAGLDTFLWGDFYEVEYCLLEDEAILWKLKADGEFCAAMPSCRQEDLNKYFQMLKEYFNQKLGKPLVLKLADEEAVMQLGLLEDKSWLVTEQEDLKDYLYDAESLRTLSGKKYHKKKNQVNKFMREYGEQYEYRSLACKDKALMQNFLMEWFQMRKENLEWQEGEDMESLEAETMGVIKILKDCDCYIFRAGGIFLDGKLEAFSIGSENLMEDMAVISIEKANPTIPGLYQVINQQFLLHEFPDVKLVNREDDVGIPGLRMAKESYHPISFARKYYVKQLDFQEG